MTEQLSEYTRLASLLEAGKNDQALVMMHSWDKVWINQFYQCYPQHYKALQHSDFNKFWAEQRQLLNPTLGFLAQNYLTDSDLVLGFVFYLLALHAEPLSEAEYVNYLELALRFKSIHAAQAFFQHQLKKNKQDSKLQLNYLIDLLNEWDILALIHETPGFLLLADGYLHLLNIAMQLKQDNIKQVHFALWKNLTLAELYEPQSAASIHNAYFGEGLALSNSLGFTTIGRLKEKLNQLITDKTIIEQAEHSAKSSFKNVEEVKLETWIEAKRQGVSPKVILEEKFMTLNPKLTG